MEITIAVLAGSLSTLLLVVVYLADRYEREPIELIQDSFLVGLVAQLALILLRWAATGDAVWSGPWMLVTAVGLALAMPYRLAGESEVDERFDGIVYTVAVAGGAACAIHLNNLPWFVATSPHHAAMAPGSEPDLRDLIIIFTGSSDLTAELGRGVVLVLIAVLVGAVVGVLQLRGTRTWRTTAACVAVAAGAGSVDLLLDGGWWWRAILVALAIGVAVAIKRRSVFRRSPEIPERDVVVLGFKTALVVFGAALLATVLLQAVIEQPQIEGPGAPAARHAPEAGVR